MLNALMLQFMISNFESFRNKVATERNIKSRTFNNVYMRTLVYQREFVA